MKDPVYKHKFNLGTDNSAGNVLEEVAQQDMHTLTGGAACGLSEWLGNKGRFCTLTVECMPSCQKPKESLM